jgi:hypothetical protein
MTVNLEFTLRVQDKGLPLSISAVDGVLEGQRSDLIVTKQVSVNDICHRDVIKVFSVKGFQQDKKQSIEVTSLKINGRSYQDFYDFCLFDANGELMEKQNVICFNGDFYMDCSNRDRIMFFSLYYSTKPDDFVYWNQFVDCVDDFGCIPNEKPHTNTWSNVPYNFKEVTKGQQIDVACFGCSVTHGTAISKKKRWSSLLDSRLKVVNFGTSAGGVDSIFSNIKHGISEFEIKSVIMLLPNMERRLLRLHHSGKHFRIPVTVNTDLKAIWPNIWFGEKDLRDSIKRMQDTILADNDNLYSKKMILDMVQFLEDYHIPYLVSSWDEQCYEFICDHVGDDKVLGFFEKVDSGIDGKHHGPLSHSQWIENNRDKIGNLNED